MEVRKIISFGSSSYVMSLPKQWLRQQELNKGDTLCVEYKGSELRVHPQEIETVPEKKETLIEAQGLSMEIIERKIVASYVSNSDIITVQGNDIGPKVIDIKRTVNKLMGMEIVEQTKSSLMLKAFLNTSEIDVNSIFRKADHNITSMFEGIEEIVTNNPIEGFSVSKEISLRDKDVNRMVFLIFRTINYIVDKGDYNTKESTVRDPLKLWGIAFFLEEVGDEVKRIAKKLAKIRNKDEKKKYFELFSHAKKSYVYAMKAFYTGNKETVYKVSSQRNRLLAKCDRILDDETEDPKIQALIQSTKDLTVKIHNLNRMSYWSLEYYINY